MTGQARVERPVPSVHGAGRRTGRPVRRGPEPMPSTRDERGEWLRGVLDAARDGELDALGALVAEYTPMLWQVARAQGLDHASAEDVVQTTWLRLVRAPEAIRTPQALVGWLITVTRREAWRVRGAGRRECPADDEQLAGTPDVEPTPEQRLADGEQDRLLWDAVHRLPRRCQELMRVVAFVSRPDYRAVAEALGMPVGSIGPTRGRCLAKLRACLADDPRWSPR